MKPLMALVLSLVVLPAAATGTFACYQDCARQGYDRGYCSNMCDRSGGRHGYGEQQQGVPRNPYLDALPDPVPRRDGRSAPPPVNVDQRCMADCRKSGHQYGYCRKECMY
jgi:hypothetical protein